MDLKMKRRILPLEGYLESLRRYMARYKRTYL